MRRIRFLVLALISTVAALLTAFLSPGNWLNRVLAISLCTVMGADSTLCAAKLAQSSNRVVAATTPTVESVVDENWVGQRSSEFDDVPASPPASNPQAPPFPSDPGPNIIRHDFDDSNQSNFSSTEFAVTSNFREVSPGLYETILRSPEGCQITRRIRKSVNSSFYESIEYKVPNPNSCGGKSYVFTFSPDNRQINAKTSEDDEFLIQIIDDIQITFTYTDRENNQWLILAEKINGAYENKKLYSKKSKICLLSKNNLMSRNYSSQDKERKANNNLLIAGVTERFSYSLHCPICADLAPKLFDSRDAAEQLDTGLGDASTRGGAYLKIKNATKINDPRVGQFAIDYVIDEGLSQFFGSLMNQAWNSLRTATLTSMGCGDSGYDPCEKLAAEDAAQEVADSQNSPSTGEQTATRSSQSTWILEFSSFRRNNSGCRINGSITGIQVIQVGNQLSGNIGWQRDGQIVAEPNLFGTISEDGTVTMESGLDFKLIFTGRIQGEMPVGSENNRRTATVASGSVEACGLIGNFSMIKQ
jgi:hypothetical protein